MKYIESQPIIDLQVILNNYERLWLMSNNQSLREAIPKIMVLFGKYHYSKNYTDVLRRHLNHIVDLYKDNGIISYKEGQYQHFLSHIEKEYRCRNNGNTFNLMGIAAKTLNDNNMTEEAMEMTARVMGSGSYGEALNIIGEYVNITSVDDDEAEDIFDDEDEGQGMSL